MAEELDPISVRALSSVDLRDDACRGLIAPTISHRNRGTYNQLTA